MTRTVVREERGSIIISVVVWMVATGLVVATLMSVEFGMRGSRRAGDSANALQLADAGVNDAVKQVATALTTSLSPPAVTLAGAGTYQFSAALDPGAAVWHIDSMGTDATGVRRRVKADAVGESLFGSALFAQSLLSLPSGAAVDSFQSGNSREKMCTKNGVIGANSPTNITFGSSGVGRAARNCRQDTYPAEGTWSYPVDGCIVYGDGSQSLPQTGDGKCPPSSTKKEVPAFTPPVVTAPTDVARIATPPICNSPNQIVGGQRYYWGSVTLRPGCSVNATNGPAIIFTDGPVDIGPTGGSSYNVNQPTSDPSICPPPPDPTLTDTQPSGNPASFYCPGWSANLRIFVVSGSAGSIQFRNHAKFWGLILAPTRPVDVDGGGNPEVEMWGAIMATASDSSAQFSLHFDDSLGGLTTGRYRVRNWREEPQS